MGADFWSDERIDTLKRLWAEGKTASAIAKKLGGVSRAAVLGKIFRLRLGPAKTGAKISELPRETQQRLKAGQSKPRQAVRRNGPARRRGVEHAAQPSRESTYKSLFELTNDCCRWPHGRPGAKTFFFCGAAGADLENKRPYCAHHMQRAYVIAPVNTATSNTVMANTAKSRRVASRAA